MTSPAGSWRIAAPTEPSARDYGDHAYYFTAQGQLVLSMAANGSVQRILLTWQERAGALVIDQPAAPREERVALLRASETTMQIGSSWYLREEGSLFDDDAPWWALVAAGAWHAIDSASSEPFIPFVMADEGAGGRALTRLVSESSEEAERAADELLTKASSERAVWVRDGRIRMASGALDAVIVTRVERGVRGLTLALPYRLDGERAVIAGPFRTV